MQKSATENINLRVHCCNPIYPAQTLINLKNSSHRPDQTSMRRSNSTTKTACPSLSVLVLLSIVFLITLTNADLTSDRQALVALRDACGGRSLLWNLSASVCTWDGVFCDQNKSNVVELHVPARALHGQLPEGVLGNLTSLHTISLRYNSLTGSIPSDIANLHQLRYLFLNGNNFSGELQPFFFTLTNLVRLNLASNSFSGQIPPAFNNLTRLKTLYLEDNNFTGPVPDLSSLKLDLFNVSLNAQLSGSIPASFSGMPNNAFLGTSLCGKPMKPCNGTDTGSGGSNLSGGAIAGIVIGSVFGLLILVLIVILLCRRKSGDKRSKGIDDVGVAKPGDVEKSTVVTRSAGVGAKGEANVSGGDKKLVFVGNYKQGSPAFDLEDLLRASAEVLGKGTFGTTYKAALETGAVVAVKRVKEVSATEMEFRKKMDEIGRMDHPNLVPLRAYYFNKDEKLLVYDFMPTGSLSALLHGNTVVARTPLNWDTRLNIALGAANAIAYLHSQSPPTSHGNIRSSNILLTKSYEARVSDFGLAHISSSTAATNRVDGYRAPEVTDTQKISQKADVYSFGVLLLEMLTGKAPSNSQLNEEGVDLPRWVQSVVQEEWTAEVFDLELLRYQDVEDDMVQLLKLAIDCTAQYPDKRPSMVDVKRRIEDICHTLAEEADDLAGAPPVTE